MNTPSETELLIIFGILFIFILIYSIPLILHFRQKKIVMKHKTLSTIKEVPFLYSWTGAVFGFWTPLLRSDFKWFFIYLIIGVPTYNLGAIILSFFYNKYYIKNLIEKGYEPENEEDRKLLISKSIISKKTEEENIDIQEREIHKTISVNKDVFYEQSLREINTNSTKTVLWAKALSQCDGELNKTKAIYINMRVQDLEEEAKKEILYARKLAKETAERRKNKLKKEEEPFEILSDGTKLNEWGEVI